MKAQINNVIKNIRRFPGLRKKAFYSLASVALAGPVVFLIVSTVLPFLNHGYNLVRDAVSALVFGTHGWLQTVGFFAFGISLLALSIVILIKARRRFNPGSALLAFMGVGFIMIGTFKGGGPGQPLSNSGIVHLISVGAVVVAFPVACLALMPSLKAWGFRGLRIYTLVVGIFAALFMVLGGPILALHYSLPGIFERVLLWNGMLWVLLTCMRLVVDDASKRRRYAFAYAVQDDRLNTRRSDQADL